MFVIPVLLVTLAAPADATEIEVFKNDGTVIRGHIAGLVNGKVALIEGADVNAGDWHALRRAVRPVASWPTGPSLELLSGDRWPGAPRGIDGTALMWDFTPKEGAVQPVRYPLSAVRAVWVAGRPVGPDPPWLLEPRKRDLVLTRTGESLLGALTAIDPANNRVRYQAEGKDQTVAWNRVAAIGMNTDLARLRKPRGITYRLTLDDGTRLTATNITSTARVWHVEADFKNRVDIGSDRVVSIDVEGAAATALSDLKPSAYQYRPYDGEQFPWVADRNVMGGPLAVATLHGAATFDRGIGLHADCTIRYALSGTYSRFEAIAGLDVREGERGDATIEVAVDGMVVDLPRKGRLTAKDGGLVLQVPVAGAKELSISIRAGNGGIVQDRVNLADARLIRAASKK